MAKIIKQLTKLYKKLLMEGELIRLKHSIANIKGELQKLFDSSLIEKKDLKRRTNEALRREFTNEHNTWVRSCNPFVNDIMSNSFQITDSEKEIINKLKAFCLYADIRSEDRDVLASLRNLLSKV